MTRAPLLLAVALAAWPLRAVALPSDAASPEGAVPVASFAPQAEAASVPSTPGAGPVNPAMSPPASPGPSATPVPLRTDPLRTGPLRTGPLSIEAGEGSVIALARPANNIFVADPKIAEVRPAGPNSLFLFGSAIGRTSLVVLDADGDTVLKTTVVVLPSSLASALAKGALRHRLPDARLDLHDSPAGILLGGGLDTPQQASEATSTVTDFLPPGGRIDNELRVHSGVQVALKVTIAEMARDVTRELGVNWQTLGTIGKYSVGFATANPLAVTSAAASLANSYENSGVSISNIIDALAQDGLARTLAEPNLTAMSGETASFLVGGEFPIPVSQQLGSISVTFKQYGVALAFVPTVLDSGRINLHVRTEVSALTSTGAVQVSAGSSSISIPAITVRRADTTIELGSGQSFAIAGLLQDQVTQTDTSIPGLDRLPVIGSLFRSSSFLHNKSELVVIVTPTIARPVDDGATLHTPDEGYVPPDDQQRLVRFDQTEQRPAPASTARVQGFLVQ